MADVSVDEIIELCPYITNKMIEYLDFFLFSMKEFENNYMNDSMLQCKDLVSRTDEIQEWLKSYDEEVNKNVSNNAHYLEILSEETDKLKALESSLQKDISKHEKEVEILKGKLSAINKKKDKLGDMRDQIQICKLLTNTSFNYRGSNVSGYVVGKQIECFELDTETLSVNDIINNLYNKVKKASQNINQPV